MTTITDDFNRANASDLGANWGDIHGNGLQIVSNTASNSADGNYDGSGHNTALTADHYAQAVIGGKASVSYFDVKGRWNGSTGASRDNWQSSVGGSNERYLTRVDDGTGTDVISNTVTFANGDTLRIECEGTTIRHIVGANSTSTTSSTYQTNTRVGLGIYRTSTVASFDNFEAGDLGASGAITGSIALTITPVGALTGSGALAGTVALSLTPVGVLRGTGALVGAISATLGVTGSLTGTGALAGSIPLILTPSGSLSGTGALASAITLSIAPSGALSGTGALIGAVALALDLTGSLTPAAPGDLNGTIPLALLTSGVLTGTGNPLGSISFSFDLTGAMTGSGALAGAIDLAMIPAGTLTDASAALVPVPAPEGFAGGFLYAYELERGRRRKRKREQEEREEEARALKDKVDAEIALLLAQQEAESERKAELDRLQALVKQHSNDQLQLSDRAKIAYVRALTQANFSAMEALDRELRRQLDEEEITALMILLNEG